MGHTSHMLRLPESTDQTLELVRARREPLIWVQYLVGLVGFFIANVAFATSGAMLAWVADPSSGGDFMRHPWPALPVGMVIYAATAVAMFALITFFIARRPTFEFGVTRWFSELGIGVLLGVALIAVSVGIVAALGGYQVSGVQVGTGILVGIGLGIGPGFAEEILFRGVLLRLLDKQIGSWAALAITSVLFGAVHLSNSGASVQGAVAIMIEAGVLLGAAYLVTRRLWFAVGIHAGWNAAQSALFSINVSGTGMGSGGLLTSTMNGPHWLTGGSMGIEGSVIAIAVGLLAGVALLVVAKRRGHLLPRVGRGAPEIVFTGGGPQLDTPAPPAPPAPEQRVL